MTGDLAGVAAPDPLPPPAADERGCRCGRRGGAGTSRPAPPLLHDDLLIAARQRNREPELPAATVEAALAAALPPETARYDLIHLPGEEHEFDPAHQPDRLLGEFARRGHRVFWLDPAGRTDRPGFPAGTILPIGPAADDEDALATLAAARRAHGIEAAVLFVTSPRWLATAAAARDRWGWRIVAANTPSPLQTGGTATADIILGAAAAAEEGPATGGTLDLATLETWPARWAALDRAVRAAFPRVSVVVLSFDNRAFTRLCLWSVLANTEYPNYELIVVDNGSGDGSVDDLRALAERHPQVRLLANETNAGFGPANNQGMAAATGEIFVLLNNDTMTPPGWLTRLARHLDDPAIGLIGPATNRTCNEAQVAVAYATYGDFLRFAREQGERHEGELRSIRMPMMFCVAMRRAVWERVGPLDERYEVGMFEDEDYALRVKAAGLATAWTPEVFIHHAYHASIGKLVPTGEYLPLFRTNQYRFEQKWSICWEPHRGKG